MITWDLVANVIFGISLGGLFAITTYILVLIGLS